MLREHGEHSGVRPAELVAPEAAVPTDFPPAAPGGVAPVQTLAHPFPVDRLRLPRTLDHEALAVQLAQLSAQAPIGRAPAELPAVLPDALARRLWEVALQEELLQEELLQKELLQKELLREQAQAPEASVALLLLVPTVPARRSHQLPASA